MLLSVKQKENINHFVIERFNFQNIILRIIEICHFCARCNFILSNLNEMNYIEEWFKTQKIWWVVDKNYIHIGIHDWKQIYSAICQCVNLARCIRRIVTKNGLSKLNKKLSVLNTLHTQNRSDSNIIKILKNMYSFRISWMSSNMTHYVLLLWTPRLIQIKR